MVYLFSGVSTIASGGRWNGGSKEESMRFSDDFDLIYVSSSCSLLVIDRGNQMIREIQLHDHDCSHQEPDSDLHLGNLLTKLRCFTLSFWCCAFFLKKTMLFRFLS